MSWVKIVRKIRCLSGKILCLSYLTISSPTHPFFIFLKLILGFLTDVNSRHIKNPPLLSGTVFARQTLDFKTFITKYFDNNIFI